MLGAAGPPHRKPKKWNVKYLPYPKQAPAKQYCAALQYCCLCSHWTESKVKHQSEMRVKCFTESLKSRFPLYSAKALVSQFITFIWVIFIFLLPTAALLLWVPSHTDLLDFLHQLKPHNHNISSHSILYQSHKLNMNSWHHKRDDLPMK